MKRIAVLLLLAALLLSGCAGEEPVTEPYTSQQWDTVFHVDPQARTITGDGCTYTFRITEDEIRIVYPDGEVYTCETERDGSQLFYGTVSTGYAMPEDLVNALEPLRVDKKEVDVLGILGGLALIGVGLWGVLAPHSAWYFSYGWRFKDAEPSDNALLVEGIGGALTLIGGIIILLVSIL